MIKKIYSLLVLSPIKDLFKYKSFLLIILIIILADKLMNIYLKPYLSFDNTNFTGSTFYDVSCYIFETLPLLLWQYLKDIRTQFVLNLLFVSKQIISMWPTSDMRLMHRGERKQAWIFKSLIYLKWHQVAFNMSMDLIFVIVGVCWEILSFYISYRLWKLTNSPLSLILLLFLIVLIIPIIFAGFSFSSNISIMSDCNYYKKFKIFFEVFINIKLLWRIWILFMLRAVIEIVFVIAIPFYAILFIDNYWMRILIASLSATPSHSFVKLMSFKFFLDIYQQNSEVYNEFPSYYEMSTKA